MISVRNITMSETAEKLRQIEAEMSAQKGAFTLFALIERDDSLGNWDVVVSANWIGKREKELIGKIASKISEVLSREEQIMLSRIVVLSPTDPFVQYLNMIGVEHGTIKLSNTSFNGIFIKEAYLITSKSQ